MAEPSRNGKVSSWSSSAAELGIPTGLNRIKTRRAVPKDLPSRSRAEGDSEKLNESPKFAAASKQKQKHKAFVKARVKFHSPKQGLHKARKIGRWFTSHLTKHPDQHMGEFPHENEYDGLNAKEFVNEGSMEDINKVAMHSDGRQSLADDRYSNKVPKVLKSFSHELGPKGGIRPVHPRAHSLNDLKDLLRSFSSRFDAAKGVVNTELDFFSQDVMEVLQKKDSLSLDGQRMVQELLELAQQCIQMASFEFRTKCEALVQELSGKRQQCQTGLVKWLLTRMLYILTRCTRLLNLEKDIDPVNESSLHKFQECLERLPFVETDWLVSRATAGSDTGYMLNLKNNVEGKCEGKNHACNLCQAIQFRAKEPVSGSDINLGKDSMVTEKKSPSRSTYLIQDNMEIHQINKSFHGELANKSQSGLFQEQEENLDDSNLVICRICEELVPVTHLEPHSYICACADKYNLQSLDVNERLWKLAEFLEQILESRNLRICSTYDSPDNTKMQTINSAIASEACSPRISDLRSKGVEGMFEDLHEMDTACIEDSQMANFANIKGHLGAKLNHCGPPSSTGSITSTSSTNTPRAGSFDFSWLEGDNPLEQEDLQQIVNLADIAHHVAGTDISEEGSHEFLLACMQDLQDVLLDSKFKALVVDTFGRRIENLLREKYIIACDLVDTKSDSVPPESTRLRLDNASQTSTPLHPLHKERTSIEDFEIIKPISRGAFGKVFLARKRTTGDLFAIKLGGQISVGVMSSGVSLSRARRGKDRILQIPTFKLNRTKELDNFTKIANCLYRELVLKKLDLIRKNDIERILAERNILITVRNPFVVRFFYSFTSRDNLYLVMEYLNGGDLYSLLRKVGCLDEDVARVYVAELVLALEYLHSLGIVHRDLKPDNILIAQDGHIKLTDFGLSKIGLMNRTGDLTEHETKESTILYDHGDDSSDTVDRGQRSAVGTPDYLAPEILLGTEHGYAADWWSVGIIVFELITGVPPFNAEHPEKVFDNILNRKIPWPAIPSEMSDEVQDLIERLLDLEPNHRLGVRGSSEVKAHPFFRGIDWDNLALQKAAFVPQPDSVDDTSYFVSRYNSIGIPDDEDYSSASEASELFSDSGLEKMDECGDLAEFNSSPIDLSLINFSFKNLSQLASINHDVLLQGGKSSSPCKGSN